MSLLGVRKLSAGYGTIQVLRDIGLTVAKGTVVALLGPNGSGKTTTLRALSGLIASTGTVTFEGRDVSRLASAHRVALGMAHIPQGRGTFSNFTVAENLALGAYTVRDRRQIDADADRWYGIFPRLAERRRQLAGSLSGGEQQMLAIARALMSRPRILMCDEPSLGLAPSITQELFGLLGKLNRQEGMTILLVEQNAKLALKIAHRAYVLENGIITVQGRADKVEKNPAVRAAYLGAG
jgi:branched-chain amino acid transport system ATP-binding protein